MIDIMVLLAAILAVLNGYRKGLIMAIFNMVSLLIGIAAAVKLSALVAPTIADYIEVGARFLPILSFLVVFVLVVLAIRLVGKILEKSLETLKIGFVNRLAGIALYIVLYIAILSVLLFFVDKTGLLSAELAEKSVTYHLIAPFGPAILDGLGSILPWFKNMFNDLNGFFEELANKATPTVESNDLQ